MNADHLCSDFTLDSIVLKWSSCWGQGTYSLSDCLVTWAERVGFTKENRLDFFWISLLSLEFCFLLLSVSPLRVLILTPLLKAMLLVLLVSATTDLIRCQRIEQFESTYLEWLKSLALFRLIGVILRLLSPAYILSLVEMDLWLVI